MTEKNPPSRRLGYARVSTYGQTLDAQLEQLRKEGCDPIYREKASGDPARVAADAQGPRPGRRSDGDADRPAGTLDRRPPRHCQADRGRRSAVPVTGGAVGRHLRQHRAVLEQRGDFLTPLHNVTTTCTFDKMEWTGGAVALCCPKWRRRIHNRTERLPPSLGDSRLLGNLLDARLHLTGDLVPMRAQIAVKYSTISIERSFTSQHFCWIPTPPSGHQWILRDHL
jgi:hypothetical protein